MLMNISPNSIDLMYLSNQNSFKIKEKNEPLYTKKDLLKYRNRIFTQTRDILKGKITDINTQAAFDEYVKISIENFKFLDKKNIIQKDYSDIKIPDKPIGKIDYNETNKLVYKKDEPTHRRITDCIAIKRKTKIKKKMIIPKQRDFSNDIPVEKKQPPEKNIAEKDNIIIRYDEKKIKEKNKNKKKEKDKTRDA